MAEEVVLRVKMESSDNAQMSFGSKFSDVQKDMGATQPLFNAQGSQPPLTYSQAVPEAENISATGIQSKFVSPPPLPPPKTPKKLTLEEKLDRYEEQERESSLFSEALAKRQRMRRGFQSKFQETIGSVGQDFIASSAGSFATQLTGSPALGSLVGGFAPQALQSLGPMAGPAGIAAAAILIGSEIQKKVESTLTSAGQNVASLVAPGDPMDPVLRGARGASSFLDPLEATIGVSTNPLDNVIRSLITSFESLDSALLSLFNNLKAYSPELASADAQRQIRQIERDFRTAEAIGEDLATYMQSREDLADVMNEIRILLAQNLIPIATWLLKNGVEITRVIGFLVEFQTNGLQAGMDLLKEIAGGAKDFQDLQKAIASGGSDGSLKAIFGPAAGQSISSLIQLQLAKSRLNTSSTSELEEQLKEFFDEETTIEKLNLSFGSEIP